MWTPPVGVTTRGHRTSKPWSSAVTRASHFGMKEGSSKSMTSRCPETSPQIIATPALSAKAESMSASEIQIHQVNLLFQVQLQIHHISILLLLHAMFISGALINHNIQTLYLLQIMEMVRYSEQVRVIVHGEVQKH